MKNKINEAFDNIDEKYIARTQNPPKKSRAIKFVLVAAALALIIAAVPLITVMSRRGVSGTTTEAAEGRYGWGNSVPKGNTGADDAAHQEGINDVGDDENDNVQANDITDNAVDGAEDLTQIFTGEKGNYSGAKFVSLANTSDTAKTVFSDYYGNLRQYRECAGKLDGFFDKLTKKLMNGQQNAVISPVNIYMALALLAECTDGDSRQQILDVLEVSDIEELRALTRLIWLYNSADDELGRSLLSDSIWLSSGLPVKNNCVNTLKDYYYASSFTGDFADENYKNALKQWLSDQTNGLLDGCINELDIPDNTAAALASTLYYKAHWYYDFYQTENGIFKGKNRTVNCVYNKKTVEGTVYSGKGFTVYSERLSDGNVMWFFLPDDNKSVSDILTVDLTSYISDTKGGKKYEVTFRMPDFDVDYNENVTDNIKDIGITDCMELNKADFSPLTDDTLVLSQIVHAARFKADKDGVEGAAYTVLVAPGASPVSAEPPKYDFTLDRPFVFAVTNCDIPLFIGVVNEL